MAAFVSTDITVAVSEVAVVGVKKHVTCTMSWGTVPTYTIGGMPMPAASAFGLRFVDNFPTTVTDGGYTMRFDRTANKMVAYYGDYNNAADGPSIEYPTVTAFPVAQSMRVTVVGS
jgi:hypothetical protein